MLTCRAKGATYSLKVLLSYYTFGGMSIPDRGKVYPAPPGGERGALPLLWEPQSRFGTRKIAQVSGDAAFGQDRAAWKPGCRRGNSRGAHPEKRGKEETTFVISSLKNAGSAVLLTC